MNVLDILERSKWLRLVRGVLLGAALWAIAEDARAEAEKAAGAPVSGLDIPVSVIGMLGLAAGLLKGGDKNP